MYMAYNMQEIFIPKNIELAMMVHAFNLSAQVDLCEFEAYGLYSTFQVS